MEEIEQLGRKLAAAQDRAKDLYVRTREAEQKYERILHYLKKLPCPNKHCFKGEIYQWKWNGKTERRRYKIGKCWVCQGTSTAAGAFEYKESQAAKK